MENEDEKKVSVEQHRKNKENLVNQADQILAVTTKEYSKAVLAVRVFLNDYDTRYWVDVDDFTRGDGMEDLHFASIEGEMFERKIPPPYMSKEYYCQEKFNCSYEEALKIKSAANIKLRVWGLNRKITSITAAHDIAEQRQLGVSGIKYEISGKMIRIPGEKSKNYKLNYAKLI